MYVTVSGEGKYRVIQFKEETRVPGTKKKKSHVIKTIGNYEKMLSENPNIIEELKAEAKRITLEQKASKAPIILEVFSEEIEHENDAVKSYYFGHGLVLQLWKKLKLDAFFSTQHGIREPQQIMEAMIYLLSYRGGDPSSIWTGTNDQNLYAGISEMGLDKLNDTLEALDQSKGALIKHLGKFFSKNTNRDTSNAYYDVTTYSFESTPWGELGMFGFSKDSQNNEVQVVMGLLMDNHGIPITYELFPGNTIDQKTLTPSISRLKELYHLDVITVVSDGGSNCGDNLGYFCDKGHEFNNRDTLKRFADKFKPMGWNEGHIRGHFALSFLALSMMKFAQHLLKETEGISVSSAKLMEAIHDPEVVVHGSFPKVIVTPIKVSDIYLSLSKTLGMKLLKKNMTLTQFRASTKLDLGNNLK